MTLLALVEMPMYIQVSDHCEVEAMSRQEVLGVAGVFFVVGLVAGFAAIAIARGGM
ncbi:MAG: hypothetical protein QM581_08315 [Pseudomonas sp.]